VFTYDVSTPAGQVRLLCTDRDANNQAFQDDEIQAFLNLNGGSVILAAAQALDQLASNEAFIQGKIKLEQLETDGTALAAALRTQADKLQKQYAEGIGDPTDAGYDYAELLLDVFSERQIWINRSLRQQI
jgi:hypothetical protein